MQEKRMKDETQSALSGEDAYSNPPSIIDSLRKEPEDANKVNPLGASNPLVGAVGAAVLVVALLAGAFGLDGGAGGGKSSVCPVMCPVACPQMCTRVLHQSDRLAAETPQPASQPASAHV